MTCHRVVIRFKWVWLVKALKFFPDDVPQVAEYTVEEIGEVQREWRENPNDKEWPKRLDFW